MYTRGAGHGSEAGMKDRTRKRVCGRGVKREGWLLLSLSIAPAHTAKHIHKYQGRQISPWLQVIGTIGAESWRGQ